MPFFITLYGAISLKEKTAKIHLELFGIVIYSRNLKYTCFTILKTIWNGNLLTKSPKPSILSIKGVINVGTTDDLFVPAFTLACFDYVKTTFCKAIKEFKPYLKLNIDTDFFLETNIFDIAFKVNAVLNLVDIIQYLFKILSEKIKNVIGK